MKNLSTEQILNVKFNICAKPLMRPWGGSFVVADPSVLTPDVAHDGRWHMFFHTTFGVYHAESDDGLRFEKPRKIANRAMRPNINYIDGRYYLFYERTRPLIMNALNVVNVAEWKSEIHVIESADLNNWTEPKPVIANTRDYEKSERGISISNPYLLQENGVNRIYYSCGLTYIRDCGFCEPTYVSYAESKRITDGYLSAQKPIISPDKNDPYLNLCSGCLKIYRIADGYIGIQNGLYEKDGKSHSAIILLTSDNGLDFRFAKLLIEPQVVDGNEWMKQFVYASHLVRYGNKLRIYFNARNVANPIFGRECIGYAEAEI